MSNRFSFIEKRQEARAPILPPLSKPPTFPYAREIVKREGMKPAPDRHKEPTFELELENMKMQQLKLIAKDTGVSYMVGWSKEKLIAAIKGIPDDAPEPDSETIQVD